jgi:hypothetical protein
MLVYVRSSRPDRVTHWYRHELDTLAVDLVRKVEGDVNQQAFWTRHTSSKVIICFDFMNHLCF